MHEGYGRPDLATPTGRAIFAIFAKSGKDAPEQAALGGAEGASRVAKAPEEDPRNQLLRGGRT